MSWVSNLRREIASSNTSQNAQSCLLQARRLVLCVNPLNLPNDPMTHVPLGHPCYRCGPRGRERLGNTFEVSLGHRPRQLRPRSVFNHHPFPPSSLGRAGGNLRGGPHLEGAGGGRSGVLDVGGGWRRGQARSGNCARHGRRHFSPPALYRELSSRGAQSESSEILQHDSQSVTVVRRTREGRRQGE